MEFETPRLDEIKQLSITDWQLHIGLIIGVWAVVYPFIAYVIWPRPWDEMRLYYPAAQYAVEHGEWFVIHHGEGSAFGEFGTPWFGKPPLVIWFQSLSIILIGDSLFAARLPSTIFGLATALLVYHVAKHLYGWRTGITAGFVFLASPMMWLHHHSAVTADFDIYMIFFGSLFVWLVWQKYNDSRWMMVAGISGAGAALTKTFGAGVFLLVLLPVVAFYWRQYSSRETIIGGLTGLAVLLPWPVYAYLTYPKQFIQGAIMRQFERIGGWGGESIVGIPNPHYFELLLNAEGFWTGRFIAKIIAHPDKRGQILAHVSLPLLVFLAAVGVFLLYRQGSFDSERDLMLVWWILSVPLFFTVVGGTHDWYIQPVSVPLAILASVTLERLFGYVEAHPGLPTTNDFQYVIILALGYSIIFLTWIVTSDVV